MASTLTHSQQQDLDIASRKIQVTVLASEWGSSKGGLSTISRELAIQLAKFPEVEIAVFLPRCSKEDKGQALKNNVKICEATRHPGFHELDWLIFPPEHLQIDVIVSHGVKFGHYAHAIKMSKQCKWVQMVLTDPEKLGMFKSYSNPILKGHEKHLLEVRLCEIADLVVRVGPKSSEAFRSYLCGFEKHRNVVDFIPGVFCEFASVKQSSEERKQFSILVFGRGDDEDFELKGFDIAGKAVAALPNTRLVFVGAQDGKHEEIKELLTACGVPPKNLRVRDFVQDREDLKRLFLEVDLVLMPSRIEGFGLTGLEALSAGLPVLVSQNSGFGKALSKVPLGSFFVIDSEDPEVWTAAIQRVWGKARQERLEEVETLRTCYEKKYSWGKQSRDLLDKMISLVNGTSDSNTVPKEHFVGTIRRTGSVEGIVKSQKSRQGKVKKGTLGSALTVKVQDLRQENWQRQLREARQREENLQRQLTEMQLQQENLQRQLANYQSQVSELQSSLSAAQQTISALRNQGTGELLSFEQGEEDPDRRKVYQETVTSEGIHLDVYAGAVHLSFPPNAVSVPTLVVIHKWNRRACSPRLQENEAIVSNVIEISTTTGQAFEFNVALKLFLCHSAPSLHGYELVIKKQIGKSNDWEDVEGTKDLRDKPDAKDDYPSSVDFSKFYFPVAQADVTECSKYAVVFRLKSSPPYTITSAGGSLSHPDYPGVVVTIPENAVASETEVSLRLKVQEVPSKEFDEQDVLIGPILRIICPQAVRFSKPVTIQVPISLGDEQMGIPDTSACRVRVLFQSYTGEREDWREITGTLRNPASFDGTFIKFEVDHFSKFWVLVEKIRKKDSRARCPSERDSVVPIMAYFFAYYCLKLPNNLIVICCPHHCRSEVNCELRSDGVTFQCGSSYTKMRSEDKAYVLVSGGICPNEAKNRKDPFLLFSDESPSKLPFRYCALSAEEAKIEFCEKPCAEEGTLWCLLHLNSPLGDNGEAAGKFTGQNGISDSNTVPQKHVLGTKRRADCLQVEGSAVNENVKSLKPNQGKGFSAPFSCPNAEKGKGEDLPSVKPGTPTNTDLQRLANMLGDNWKNLGRQLLSDDDEDYCEARLTSHEKENEKLPEKAYAMLLDWKRSEGKMATFQTLYHALCHDNVKCKKIAEKFCF